MLSGWLCNVYFSCSFLQKKVSFQHDLVQQLWEFFCCRSVFLSPFLYLIVSLYRTNKLRCLWKFTMVCLFAANWALIGWFFQDIAVVPLLVILPVLESQVSKRFSITKPTYNKIVASFARSFIIVSELNFIYILLFQCGFFLAVGISAPHGPLKLHLFCECVWYKNLFFSCIAYETNN